MKYLFLIGLTALLAGCAGTGYRNKDVPITPVATVDLDRYQGRWYEIARFPNSFEKGCVGVTADYSIKPSGLVKVVNTCIKGSLNGRKRVAEGTAFPVNLGKSKLRVDFVPLIPFTSGWYWVLGLDDAYRTVVVGNPSGSTGWILAREPQISEARLQWGYDVLRRNGYDVSQMTLTPQKSIP